MPTPAYISIQGNITQGAFTADSVGNVYQDGHEDQILVQEIEHLIATPTDPQSGQPSGQRVHKPHLHRTAEQGHAAAVPGAGGGRDAP